MSGAASAAAWLTIADNQQTWARLSDSLALADGFELVFAVVVDQQAADWLTELLEARARELSRRFVRVDAREHDVLERLTSLDGGGEVLVALDTIAAIRGALASFDRGLLELNPRRDLLVETIPGPLVVIVRPDGLRRFADLAPDLFSVHTASFRLFGGAELGLEARPEWLLLDHEFVGLLGIDPSFGFADRSRVPKIVREPPQPPARLIGREVLLAELEARLVPGGERLLEISGEPGVGRTALLARAVELVGERWDRVIWLDCRHVWQWTECNTIVDAVLEELAPNEVPPFSIEDAHERFVELTTLYSVLIIADDLYGPPLAVTGPRSCLVDVCEAGGTFEVPPLGGAALHELGRAEGLLDEEISTLFEGGSQTSARWLGLPGSVRVLGRWLRTQDGRTNEALARLCPSEAGIQTPAGLHEMCAAIAEDAGPNPRDAFDLLDALSGWVSDFPRGLSVHEDAFAKLERLGILICTGNSYRFSETGIGDWEYLNEGPFSPDWRVRFAVGTTGEQLYATLAGALWMQYRENLHWLSAAGLTRDDLERAVASAPPAVRAAVWSGAVRVQPQRKIDEQAWLRAAVTAALRCGQAEEARATNKYIANDGSNLLDMLVRLRPSEWGPDPELSVPSVRRYAMNQAEPAIAAALGRGFNFSLSFPADPLPDAPPARVALALRGDACSQDELRDVLATLDQTRELDRLAAHFIWSHLAWLQILANDWPNYELSHAEVQRSARAWGSPYALVRLRLLELTALEVRGELDHAADRIPASLAAVDRCHGTRSHTALALLRRAVRIYTELERSDDAQHSRTELRNRRSDN